MTPFSTLTATALPLMARNVDTDVIIPARYLKATTKTGMGRGAFYTLRFNDDGSLKADSPFADPCYQAAQILLAGENFGCGSSREHAAWALDDLGYKVVIAPSFSDIFAGNAFKNGLLTVELPQAQIERLAAIAAQGPITVDLDNQVVTTCYQDRFPFEIDPFRKHCLLHGLDEIGLTLRAAPAIRAYEAATARTRPWVTPAQPLHTPSNP